MDLKELGLSDEQMALVSKYAQSEADKVRTEYSTKLKGVNEELSKYKPKEKTPEELTLEDRLAKLELREKEIATREKSMTLTSKLAEKGLPKELAKYLNVGEDIDKFVDEVGATVNNYFLNNGSKPDANHTKQQAITKEQFKKMSYSERAKLATENEALYKALSN